MNISPSDIEFDDTLVRSLDPQTDLSFLTQEPATASQGPVADGEVGPSKSTDTAAVAPPANPVAASADEKQPETAPSPASPALGDAVGSDDQRYFSLVLRDGLDLGIADLDVFVTLPNGQMCQATTSEHGAVAVPVPDQAKGLAKVEVKDVTGARQEVCRLDLERCGEAVIVRSPKVKAKLPLRPHQQTPPPKSTKPATAKASPKAAAAAPTQPAPPPPASWWRTALDSAWAWVSAPAHVAEKPPTAATSATVQKTLSGAGQPVTVMVGPECPNKDCLRLGRNNLYREAILDASKRLGLIPQALCALLDCEAGKVAEKIPKVDAKGMPLKDKKGHPLTTTLHELWNANAGNPQSGAAGLTQFLASTWLTHVLKPGFYIHEQSAAKGWVRQAAFVLADGKTTTAPYSKRGSDANVKACLAMRMDPTWSINAAADYGAANLKVLEKAGFRLAGLTDMDKAKLMYLMHHEGEGAGPAFIRNTLGQLKGGTEGLKKKFATQLGASGAAKIQPLIDAAKGDVEFAYRRWLSKFIDDNFSQATKYFCSTPIEARELSALLGLVGGEEI